MAGKFGEILSSLSIGANQIIRRNSTDNGFEAVDVVTSVNTQTGNVVLNADSIDDSSTTNKFVTSTEIATWNAKQDSLVADVNYLTPSTASTTYEPLKGSNDNYVTDAEKTKLSNLSGTNTGDQDLSTYVLKSNVLELTNTTSFTPDADYEPSTKKYVDDNTAWKFIQSVNTTNVSSIAFTDLSSYLMLRLTFKIKVSLDGSIIMIRTSTNNGSSYNSSTGNYDNVMLFASGTGVSADSETTSTFIWLSDVIGNGTNEYVTGEIIITDFNKNSYGGFFTKASHVTTVGNPSYQSGGGSIRIATARNAIQISPNVGNLSYASIVLEGIKG